MNALILARRIFAVWFTRDAADIIRHRALLPAVKALEHNSQCAAIDPTATIKETSSCHSHFGYESVSKVNPLAFGWRKTTDFSKHLVTSKIPQEQMPNGDRFATPMLTLIDYANENVCGHPGLIHGGMTTVIAHSSMSLVAAINAPGKSIVPVSLNMDYRKPIRAGDFVKVHAWLYDQHCVSNSASGALKLKAAVHFYSLNDELLVEAISDLMVTTASTQ
ncbi:hypothetical protein LPJ66_001211 [Kickxella alabastrina]|uniref:Uncharacterized protein n=1 Tax=Kickxella alabastrina TaxID=61397 RepID=A0ACC1ITX0_9FUNG|nr:hypothetical protein LPJ66_001211 [Kickxella alabastrina]